MLFRNVTGSVFPFVRMRRKEFLLTLRWERCLGMQWLREKCWHPSSLHIVAAD